MAFFSICISACKTFCSFTREFPCNIILLASSRQLCITHLLLPQRCKSSLQTSFSVMFVLPVKFLFDFLLKILGIETLKPLINCSGSLFVIANPD